MKSCTQCKLNYSDDSLEYCLEDGTKLVFINENQTERPTVVRQLRSDSLAERTADLPFSDHAAHLKTADSGKPLSKVQSDEIFKNEVFSKSEKVLEIGAVAISLAHNWWQWVYLNNQYYYSFWDYFLSANFLMWLLLLISGAIIALISLKRSQNKSFAIVSLVVLAINLLLFLVPKR